MTKPYVAHDCRNAKCNQRWLDVDEYNATAKPPKHRYCNNCLAKGYQNKKDPVKVANGKKLAAIYKRKKPDGETNQ